MGIRFISDIVVRIASALVVLFFVISIAEMAYVALMTYRCPLSKNLNSLSEPKSHVLSLAQSQDPADISRAAEYLYEQRLVTDEDTYLGFRNICLAEDLHRVAAARGDATSNDWLVQYYGRENFPQPGSQHPTRNCTSLAWQKFDLSQDEAPDKPFVLSRYLTASPCGRSIFSGDNERLVVEAAIKCVIRANLS